MKDLNNIAVVGVSGYTGFELAKILLRHPEARALTFHVRETQGAHCLTELFPQLRGKGQAAVRAWSVEAIVNSGAGTAFLATGAARQCSKVEPFVGFDQVDHDTATARRIGHAKLEQCFDIAGFSIG